MKAIIKGETNLAKFLAELVRQGICFESTYSISDEHYIVTFSGGC